MIPYLLAGRKAFKALQGPDAERKVRFNFNDEQIEALTDVPLLEASIPADEVWLMNQSFKVTKWKGIH